MRFIAIVFFLSISIISCKEGTSESKPAETVKEVVGQAQKALPPVPKDLLIKMYQEVDHIDYMFRFTNFSVSQDEKAAVQAMITTFSDAPPVMTNDTCQSPLRLTFLSQGSIMVETEMYMSLNCQYVEYYIDNVKTYQSNHSEAGYNFLLNLFKQAQNVPRN